ncbi:DUF4430 domain-containing protein [Streptococcus dentiloxodontae]
MKKLIIPFFVLASLFLLAACGNSSADKSTQSSVKDSDSAGHVTLILTVNDNSKEKQVSFEKGDTVQDVLEATYKVKEEDNFITSIDGVSQDKDAGIYWMFKVNDELAPKAANQTQVQDGDRIEFYQETYH